MKLRTLLFSIVIIFLMITVSRCYYDSEEYLFPDTGSACDTVNITYSQSVVPIIQNNCLTCHANNVAAALGGNVRLEDYGDVKARADDGKLLGTISWTGTYVQMPQGARKLDNCLISTVRLWIEAGALQN